MPQTFPHLQIQTENGRLKRVTLESPLVSIAEATEIQRTLIHTMPDLFPKPVADFHLTLIHIGQPEALWAEITEFGIMLDFKEYLGHFMTLLEATDGLIADPFWLEVEGLAEFGNPSEPMVVLHLVADHWLVELREQTLEMLSQMLVNCGIMQPLVFMDKSYNLHHQLPEHFKAHVSLGKVPHTQTMPNIEVSGLRLNFGPSRLRNVEVL